jgi:putative transposase
VGGGCWDRHGGDRGSGAPRFDFFEENHYGPVLADASAMTAPRHLLPDTTYLLTRRCTQGECLLRGDAETNRIFLYWVAVAAQRSGVEVHGYVQMANHWHAVVTDRTGNLPEFVHDLHRGIAVDMNTKLKRRENFWSSGRTSVVPLRTADLVLEKLAEMITNPVAAGFVKSPRDWPGSLTTGLCETHIAYRPEGHSRANGKALPAHARLDCTMPPALRDLAPNEAARLLKVRVAASMERATERVREAGTGFLGADRVRTMPRSGPPMTRSGPSDRKPWVTRLSESLRQEIRAQERVFRQAYAAALSGWRAMDRSVVFPAGTYLMRVFHRASCAAPAVV